MQSRTPGQLADKEKVRYLPTFTNGNIYKWAVRQANKWDKRTFKLKEDKQHRLQIYSGSKPAFAGTPKM